MAKDVKETQAPSRENPAAGPLASSATSATANLAAGGAAGAAAGAGAHPIPTAPHATSLELEAERRSAKIERRLVRLRSRIAIQSERLRFSQNARLWTAGAFFAGLFLATLKPQWKLEVFIIPVFLIVFSYFVIRTRRLRNFSEGLEALTQFLERQRLRTWGAPSGRKHESALKLVSHEETALALNRDLGVIGSHSLFTLLDETLTDRGERRLLEWLSPKPRDLSEILRRQSQIQNLRPATWFYTRLALIANSDQFRVSSDRILQFIGQPFLGANFAKLFGLVLAGWLAVLVSFAFYFLVGWQYAGVVLVAFAALNMWAMGQVGPTFKKGVGLELHLSLLAPIFAKIEKRLARDSAAKTDSPSGGSAPVDLLSPFFPTTKTAGPARQAKKLTSVLSILGVETNPLVSLLINVILPWSMFGNYLLEKRRKTLAAVFPYCLEELAEFEVIGSLLILDHYQTKTYPRFSELPGTFKMEGVFHPLIARAQVVANDFAFPDGQSLGLLTGSNMAGKSTFLRTVGVNQLLAQMGAPVFATDYFTHPFLIETCIEVSDSLRDGFSYFYAEVRRLRDLLRITETGRPVLYLVDEIFRGTNNRERHIGSRAVIKHLAKQERATGFISTHDLELVALEKTEPRLMNLHFRENFEAGQMIFHYKLRHGPCPTSNALKIMQAEGIVIEENLDSGP